VATSHLNRKQVITTSKQSVFDLRQIATILFYRRFLILGVSCAVISVTSLLAVITKPMYQSSMQIMVTDDLDQELRSTQSQIQNQTQSQIDVTSELNNSDNSSRQ
jgi:uncharacterized protein involved in exopolysaccharide biosynthesis